MIYILYKHNDEFKIGTYHRNRLYSKKPTISIYHYSDLDRNPHYSSNVEKMYDKVNRKDIIDINKSLIKLEENNPEYFI